MTYKKLALMIVCLLALLLHGCQISPSKTADSKETVGELEIKMLDMSYQPAVLDVPRTGHYVLKVTNPSAVLHDIELANGVRMEIKPGQSATKLIDVPEQGLTYRCSMPGHEQAGMKGIISVNGKNPVQLHTQIHTAPLNIKPRYFDPKAPPLRQGKVHYIELVALERDMAVATNAIQNLWTFNNQVPGPVIRVKVGDTLRVHLVNPSSNKLAHSVDFHASQVAWNDEMASINPGESKIYEWRADYAGVWMYHCGSNPALHHIASGMYGMVIVEPEGGLPSVDHEFAIVQSEFYLGEQGGATDLTKAASSHASPDYVVFNGVAMQYKDTPIPVQTGKKVRIFVMNAGPNEDSAFHVVGTIFNRVIKEGVELIPDNKGHWGSQAVDLAPSQGAIVEFTTAEDGLYPMVTHAFNYVGKGALGLFKAGDGNPRN